MVTATKNIINVVMLICTLTTIIPYFNTVQILDSKVWYIVEIPAMLEAKRIAHLLGEIAQLSGHWFNTCKTVTSVVTVYDG